MTTWATDDHMRTHLIAVERLRRKLSEKDKKISSLRCENARLSSLVSLHITDLASLDFDRRIELAVTRALTNVRMIPISGAGQTSKILEVTIREEDPQ